jgi:hypothetical protein
MKSMSLNKSLLKSYRTQEHWGLTLPDKEHNVQAYYFSNSSKLKSPHPARTVILQKNNKYLAKNKQAAHMQYARND